MLTMMIIRTATGTVLSVATNTEVPPDEPHRELLKQVIDRIVPLSAITEFVQVGSAVQVDTASLERYDLMSQDHVNLPQTIWKHVYTFTLIPFLGLADPVELEAEICTEQSPEVKRDPNTDSLLEKLLADFDGTKFIESEDNDATSL
jgi:hypothetical protein